ncbi:uncharacterized protein LOC125003480 [Mugil cephalus]|uniref:uncharacterized protein LOC125003480 n=1 Tax=Mugil cephalus TaxID=48193 RepID=UPI001FB68C16|nr:uncharacterized protein LOC125003480 [Mugil cephalus]XP_047433392.1 uncharacterized protein LOC125003480 [Mugil cephalus]
MTEHLRERYNGSSPPDLRMVLLGNIGCGKTTSADTILNQLSPISPSASRTCQLRQGFTEGRNVTLVEAPRWYWNGGKIENSVRKETERAMTLAPSPHVVLLLVPVYQFTEIEGHVPAMLKEVFGKEVLDHTLVLLTCGDYLMGKTVEEYLQKEHPGLREMIECCGGRYHVFNNRQRQDREQVRTLLEKVDSMVQTNGVYFMKTVQERELEKRVEERKRELMESYRMQKEEKRRTVVDSNSLERRVRKEERDESVSVSQVSNGLHSAAPESYSEPPGDILNSTSSFKLNTDGAILSQISERKSTPKVISTFHHRINSFEENSPEVSPTASPPSPISSSSLSSPTFAPSPSSSAHSSPPSSSLSYPEVRLVLLGRSGAGKSAAGNVILGKEAFYSHPDSLTAITQECEKKKALVEGKWVAVVDTPDWFNTEHTPEEVRAQISSCVALSSPGPHVFLLCVPLDQPAKTELQALRAVETVFGPEAVQSHTLVLFTYADRLRASGKAGSTSVEAYIANQRADLLKLVEKCGDRFHVMETGRDGVGKRNVAELLEKVEQTVKEAGGQCYSSPAFQEAENRVRQRQMEIAKERRGKTSEQETDGYVGQLRSERRVQSHYMQHVAEEEEEVGEEEIEKTRDEAEMSVSAMNIESLPPITLSSMSPSLLRSMMEKMEASAKKLPKLLADSSVWVEEGAKKMKSSQVWGTVGSGAQNVQKMVVDSSAWGKLGATAGHVSKAIGDRVPKVVVDGSAWVGSGAKAAAASPLWEKVGSGAKLVADGSMRVGAGIGAGTKNLAQSSVWGKVGSGAKTGAKLVANSSVKVGSGIGAGAKKVAQSPVWGKVGSGAKAGAKMVTDSSVWEKIGTTAKKVPMVVIGGAVLGLMLGVFLGGVIGGAVGAAAGSAVTEVGRRRFGNKSTLEKTNDVARNVERTVDNSIDSVLKQGQKALKTD